MGERMSYSKDLKTSLSQEKRTGKPKTLTSERGGVGIGYPEVFPLHLMIGGQNWLARGPHRPPKSPILLKFKNM